MRNLTVLLLSVVVVGCGANQPVMFTGPAPSPQALACVRDEFARLGYREEGTTASSITGIRVNEPPWYKRVLGFRSSVNQITATSSAGQLEVTAFSTDAADPAEGGRAGSGEGANEATARDARQIIGVCTATG